MKSRNDEERRAAALSYKQGYYAPVVVARGKGVAAEAIIACAREAGVYVHESPELVSLLMQVDTLLLQVVTLLLQLVRLLLQLVTLFLQVFTLVLPVDTLL